MSDEPTYDDSLDDIPAVELEPEVLEKTDPLTLLPDHEVRELTRYRAERRMLSIQDAAPDANDPTRIVAHYSWPSALRSMIVGSNVDTLTGNRSPNRFRREKHPPSVLYVEWIAGNLQIRQEDTAESYRPTADDMIANDWVEVE